MDNQKLLAQIIEFLAALFSKKQPAPAPQPEIAAKPAPGPSKPSFTLTRKDLRYDGIFSVLTDKDGNLVANTLEHSYDMIPKIPNGVWKCVRGPHRLHNMTEDFITFEISGIEGHDNLLFHWGNYNKDSDGCVLLGESAVEIKGAKMVTNSKATFAKFMASLDGVDEFELTVC